MMQFFQMYLHLILKLEQSISCLYSKGFATDTPWAIKDFILSLSCSFNDFIFFFVL